MSSVDDRIVNMQFNNSQFQSGAASASQSLSTLEGTISKMGSSTGLTSMGSDVDGISARFSALQVTAVTALATIVNKAVEAGLALIKSFTIDPILAGFHEYETNLNSIQVIMANTGESVKTVGVYLQELNEYSDRTIYSFSQMASAIGKFTAAGVALPAATSAIKGMANAAALSGSTVDQLNVAMYQMSQALSTGTIRLMDWNSLANAGMGGENIRNALMATNRTLGDNGVAMDAAVKAAGSFRDSLQAGWLTAETFNKTMKVFAGTTNKAGETVAYTVSQLEKMGYDTGAAKELSKLSQAAIDSATKVKTFSQAIDVVKESIGSGVAQMFTNLFGNFKEATALWTGVTTKITDSVAVIFDAINTVLEGWRELGGYEDLWTGIGNIFQTLGNLMAPFVAAFKALLPTTSAAGSGLAKATSAFVTFTGWIEQLTSGLTVLTPVITAVFSSFKFIAGIIGNILQGLAPVVGLIGELANKMGDMAQQGIEIGKSLIDGILEGMGITDIRASIENFANSIVEWIKSALGIASPAAELVPVGEAIVLGIAEGIANGIKVLGEALNTVLDAIMELLPVIYMKFLKIPTLFIMAIADALPAVRLAMVSIISSILGTLGDAIPAVVGLVNDLLSGIFNILTTNIPKLADLMMLLTTELLGYLSAAIPMFVNTGLEIILAIAKGLADAAPMLARYAGEIIAALATAFIGAIGTLFSTISSELNLGFGDSLGNIDWAKIFNALIAGGVVVALMKFATDWHQFVQTFISPFGALTDTLSAMQTSLKASALMMIAVAVGVLAASLIALSLIKSEKLNQGLGAISALGIMLGTLLLALNRLPPGKIESASASLVLLAGAIVLLSGAIAILGRMDLWELAKGIGAIAWSMGILVGALYAMNRFGAASPEAALGIALMAGAIFAIAVAMRIMSKLDIGDIAGGLFVMGVSLAIFVRALQTMTAISATAVASAGAIALLAGAMIIMATAIKMLGTMDPGELGRGLGVMAIGLGILVVALQKIVAMGPLTGSAAGAIVLMAASMLIMASAISILGNLTWEEIAKGLVGLAGAMIILLVAARVASDPTIMAGLTALGGAFLAIGGGAALAGIGILAVATALSILATVGAAGFAVIAGGLITLMALLPAFAAQVALAIVSFIQTLAEAAPKLREGIVTIVTEMLGAFRDLLPEFAKTINEVIDTIVKVVQNSHKEVGKIFTTLIETGLKVIRQTVPDFVKTGITILKAFMDGLIAHEEELRQKGTTLIKAFIRGLGESSADIIKTAGNTLIKFMEEMEKWTEGHVERIVRLGREIGENIAKGIIEGLTSPQFLDALDISLGIISDRMKGTFGSLWKMFSPSRVSMQWGSWIVEGLAIGIKDNIGRAVAATVAMANATIAAGDKVVAKAQKEASKRQYAADSAAARARIADQQARAAEKLAKQSPKNKILQKAATEARKRADAIAKAAADAQKKADAAVQNVSDVQAFRDADKQGKGDILSARAKLYSDRALKMLAQANEEAKAAKKLQGKERDRMLKQAREDAAAAKKLADKSKESQRRAAGYYAQAVKDRIKALNDAQKKDEQAQKRQDAFDSATDEGKAEILARRAEAAQKRSEAAQKQADAYIKQAKKLAKTDAVKAQRLLDRAERLAQQAKDAADQAKQDQDSAKQYADQANNPDDTTTSTPTSFSLSRSAMEDAASAIDRYTKSLQQAEDAIQASMPIYQFVQHNNSPDSLTELEIYRQTKNLLSAAEVQMVAPT